MLSGRNYLALTKLLGTPLLSKRTNVSSAISQNTLCIT